MRSTSPRRARPMAGGSTAALARGIDVLCQKPLAPTLAEARRRSPAWSPARARLMVHENWRFRPWYRELKRWLEAGELGTRPARATLSDDLVGPAARRRRPPGRRSSASLSWPREERLMIAEVLIHQLDVAALAARPAARARARAPPHACPSVTRRDAGRDLPGDRRRRAGRRRRHHGGARPTRRARRTEFELVGERASVALAGIGASPARAAAADGELRFRRRLPGELRRGDPAISSTASRSGAAFETESPTISRRCAWSRTPTAPRAGEHDGPSMTPSASGQRRSTRPPCWSTSTSWKPISPASPAPAAAHGVAWRPHVKGHKTPEIARMQIAAGAIGITCAKLGEAEVMADAGIRDILIANQIVGPLKIAPADRAARPRRRRSSPSTSSPMSPSSAEAAAGRRSPLARRRSRSISA